MANMTGAARTNYFTVRDRGAFEDALVRNGMDDVTVIDGRGDVRMGMVRPKTDDVRAWPGVPHPIVRTVPESGRKALYLGGRRHAWIIGMEPDESSALLDRLWTHCIQDRFVWCQQWQPGDMVMWDNRCVMHRRDAFDPNTIRLMHRTAIEGERPV